MDRRNGGEGRRLFGEMLVEAGLVTRRGLDSGLEEQRQRRGSLGYNLLKLGQVTPAALHLFLRETGEVLAPDLMEALRTAPAIDRISARLAHFYGMAPARVRDGLLTLAVSAADSPRLIPSVEELTGLRVEPLVCPPALIAGVLARFYPAEIEPGVIFKAAGDNVFVLSDGKRGIRPMLPEALLPGAPAAEWLRAISAEGIRRQARTVQVEPTRSDMRVSYGGPHAEAQVMSAPRGAYAGIARLLEGLAGMASRGRVVPREGRLAVRFEGRRLALSVRALPAFEGDLYSLDLRAERVAAPSRREVDEALPGLAPLLDGLVARGRGLILVAGASIEDAAAALCALLQVLGDRLPKRVSMDDWASVPSIETLSLLDDEDQVPFEPLLEKAVARDPDLLILPDLARPGCLPAALALAGDRLVVARVESGDAFEAAERLARAAPLSRPSAGAAPAGILAARLMERLCPACRRPADLRELLPPAPPRRRGIAPGPFFVGQGCAACRGSGTRVLEPLLELMAAVPGEPLAPAGASARDLRERHAAEGKDTLFLAGLRKASTGALDVREPLRLLLHEQP
jgi:type II secretory ATPase GspE/PulE/Tfp pilus assembly ATPase PilB-like protein